MTDEFGYRYRVSVRLYPSDRTIGLEYFTTSAEARKHVDGIVGDKANYEALLRGFGSDAAVIETARFMNTEYLAESMVPITVDEVFPDV